MSQNKKSLILYFLFILFSISLCPLQAKTDKLKEERVHMINLCHLAVGLDLDLKERGFYCPNLQFRFGHEHELFNYIMDMGAGISYGPETLVPVINSSVFTIGVAVRENLWNYHYMTLCLSEKLSFSIPMNAVYVHGDNIVNDSSLIKNHLSASIKLSIVVKNLEVGMFCCGTINPMYNQKYIYESYIYDYQACSKQINSRLSLGLSLMFHVDL